jgi:hypothetical protein
MGKYIHLRGWNVTQPLKRIVSENEKCDYLHYLLTDFKSDWTFVISEIGCNFHGISNIPIYGNPQLAIWAISLTSHCFLFPPGPKWLNAMRYPQGMKQVHWLVPVGMGRRGHSELPKWLRLSQAESSDLFMSWVHIELQVWFSNWLMECYIALHGTTSVCWSKFKCTGR